MPEFTCKFNIGDLVASQVDVRGWANGSDENVYVNPVLSVYFGKDGQVLVSTSRFNGINQDKTISANEVKAYAISILTERLSFIAAAKTEDFLIERGR